MKRGVSNAVVLLFILAILSVLIFRDSFTGGDSFSGGITGAASSQISNLLIIRIQGLGRYTQFPASGLVGVDV